MTPSPPFETPPPQGGTVTFAQKAQEILSAEGAKENVYKAPKLIYTVILWYSFVVRPPPPLPDTASALCPPPVPRPPPPPPPASTGSTAQPPVTAQERD